LVNEDFGLTCGLEVLLFQHGHLEGVFSSGDLDNRIKTLIDGLKKPQKMNAFGEYQKPSRGESPFYCLLEDDSLVSAFSVKSDQLYPINKKERNEHYVKAVLSVTIRPTFLTKFNLAFI